MFHKLLSLFFCF